MQEPQNLDELDIHPSSTDQQMPPDQSPAEPQSVPIDSLISTGVQETEVPVAPFDDESTTQDVDKHVDDSLQEAHELDVDHVSGQLPPSVPASPSLNPTNDPSSPGKDTILDQQAISSELLEASSEANDTLSGDPSESPPHESTEQSTASSTINTSLLEQPETSLVSQESTPPESTDLLVENHEGQDDSYSQVDNGLVDVPEVEAQNPEEEQPPSNPQIFDPNTMSEPNPTSTSEFINELIEFDQRSADPDTEPFFISHEPVGHVIETSSLPPQAISEEAPVVDETPNIPEEESHSLGNDHTSSLTVNTASSAQVSLDPFENREDVSSGPVSGGSSFFNELAGLPHANHEEASPSHLTSVHKRAGSIDFRDSATDDFFSTHEPKVSDNSPQDSGPALERIPETSILATESYPQKTTDHVADTFFQMDSSKRDSFFDNSGFDLSEGIMQSDSGADFFKPAENTIESARTTADGDYFALEKTKVLDPTTVESNPILEPSDLSFQNEHDFDQSGQELHTTASVAERTAGTASGHPLRPVSRASGTETLPKFAFLAEDDDLLPEEEDISPVKNNFLPIDDNFLSDEDETVPTTAQPEPRRPPQLESSRSALVQPGLDRNIYQPVTSTYQPTPMQTQYGPHTNTVGGAYVNNGSRYAPAEARPIVPAVVNTPSSKPQKSFFEELPIMPRRQVPRAAAVANSTFAMNPVFDHNPAPEHARNTPPTNRAFSYNALAPVRSDLVNTRPPEPARAPPPNPYAITSTSPASIPRNPYTPSLSNDQTHGQATLGAANPTKSAIRDVPNSSYSNPIKPAALGDFPPSMLPPTSRAQSAAAYRQPSANYTRTIDHQTQHETSRPLNPAAQNSPAVPYSLSKPVSSASLVPKNPYAPTPALADSKPPNLTATSVAHSPHAGPPEDVRSTTLVSGQTAQLQSPPLIKQLSRPQAARQDQSLHPIPMASNYLSRTKQLGDQFRDSQYHSSCITPEGAAIASALQASAEKGSINALTGIAAMTPVQAESLMRRQFPLFKWSHAGRVIQIEPANALYGAELSALATVKVTATHTVIDATFPDLLQSFPTPLTTASKGAIKSKRKELEKWEDQKIKLLEEQLNSAQAQSDKFFAKRLEHKVLLWRIVSLLVASGDANGLINYQAGPSSANAKVLEPHFAALINILNPQVSIAREKRKQESDNLTLAGQLYAKTQYVKDSPSDDSTISFTKEMTSNLEIGDRESALRCALDKRMWAHALVIAFSLGSDRWTEAVAEFVREEVHSDSSLDSAYIATMFRAIAGAGPDAISEIYPRKNAPTEQYSPAVIHSSLDRWNILLASMLSAPSPKYKEAIAGLGNELLNHGYVEAAHICTPSALNSNQMSQQDAHFQILGSLTCSENDLDSVLLSEILEFALTATDLSLMPHFKSHMVLYKLIHVSHLLSRGHIPEAARLMESVTAHLKASLSGTPPNIAHYATTLLQTLQVCEQSIGATGSGWFGGKLGKPTLDRVWGHLDKSFTKFVAGEEIEQAPVDKSKPQSRSGESTVFDRFVSHSVPASAPALQRARSHAELNYSNMYPPKSMASRDPRSVLKKGNELGPDVLSRSLTSSRLNTLGGAFEEDYKPSSDGLEHFNGASASLGRPMSAADRIPHGATLPSMRSVTPLTRQSRSEVSTPYEASRHNHASKFPPTSPNSYSLTSGNSIYQPQNPYIPLSQQSEGPEGLPRHIHKHPQTGPPRAVSGPTRSAPTSARITRSPYVNPYAASPVTEATPLDSEANRDFKEQSFDIYGSVYGLQPNLTANGTSEEENQAARATHDPEHEPRTGDTEFEHSTKVSNHDTENSMEDESTHQDSIEDQGRDVPASEPSSLFVPLGAPGLGNFPNYSMSSLPNTGNTEMRDTYDDDDDEDLGLSNAKPRSAEQDEAKNQSPKAGQSETPSQKDTAGKGRKNSITITSASSKKGGGSWFSWLRKGSVDPDQPQAVKAKLGEESSFVYDPDLKRWVNKKIPMEDQKPSTPAPPPKSKRETGPKPDPEIRPVSRTTSMPIMASREMSNAPSPAPRSTGSTIDDLLSAAPSATVRKPVRRSAKSRYVDIMNPGS